jgi:hypothetical protein
MRRRDQRLNQICAVEREYEVIALATDTLNQRLAADSSWLTEHGLGRRDLEQAVRNLQATYIVRLFAEFETGLRSRRPTKSADTATHWFTKRTKGLTQSPSPSPAGR